MGSIFSRQLVATSQMQQQPFPVLQTATHTETAAAAAVRGAGSAAAAAQAHDLLHECFATVAIALPAAHGAVKQAAMASSTGQLPASLITTEAKSIAPPVVPRREAEKMIGHIDNIGKGYCSTPTDRHHVLLAAVDGILTASRAQLLDQIPDEPGSYMFLIRAPHAQHFFPIYKGQAGGPDSSATLKSAFERYLHGDSGAYAGTIGDLGTLAKFVAVVDAMSRGFSVQFRFRTQHPSQPAVADAEHASSAAELAQFDFPLNDKSNGHRRPIMVPVNGGHLIRAITDYPIVHEDLAEVVQRNTAVGV